MAYENAKMLLGLKRSLRSLVSEKFTAAQASQALLFSETQLAVLRLPLGNLRYCPTLAKKPTKSSHDESNQSKKPFDPFDDPPSALLVTAIPVDDPSHNLVLNKYPVIRDHFILATKDNKPQTDLLEEDDLLLAYQCIQAWQEEGSPVADNALFAFFNSGEHSGASQVHRHLQFLPVEAMKEQGGEDWDILCKTMDAVIYGSSQLWHNPRLPFLHFATKLHPSMSAGDIHRRYRLLLGAGLAGVHNLSLDSLESIPVSQHGKTTFSYNLAITTNVMAIMPRHSESSSIADVLGSSIAINGTILAGTMMVKTEDEWERLRKEPNLFIGICYKIGFPPTQLVSTREKENL